MDFLRRIFDFYIDASIHIAFAVVSLMIITCIFFNISLDYHLGIFIFFGSTASYNFIKYGVDAKRYILVSNRYHKKIQLFSILGLFVAIYHAIFLSKEVWLAMGFFVILIGIYALPVLPRARNLRSLGVLKVLLVAVVWAGVTVLLPIISERQYLGWDVWLEAFQRVLLVLALVLPFEIRDIKVDRPSLGTIPQRFGISSTKYLGGIACVLFFTASFLKNSITVCEVPAKGVLTVLLLLVLYHTKRDQSKYFASFWVEAFPVFWLLVVWFLCVYLPAA